MNGCRIKNSTNQSLPNAANTPLNFDTVIFDTDGYYNPAQPDRITIPVGLAGYYDLRAHTQWGNDSPKNERLSWILVNGNIVTVEHRQQVSANNMSALVPNTIWYLNEGDYVQSMAMQNSGVNVRVLATTNHSPILAAVRIP